MRKPKLVAIALFLLLIAIGVNAQELQEVPPAAPLKAEQPVWALEFIKVKPGMFAATMGYLDDNWIPQRAEAKRQGAVLNYNRVADNRRDRFLAEQSSNNDWDI